MPETPPEIYAACKAQADQQSVELCPDDHCNQNNVKSYTHDMCYCLGTYAKYKINGVCPFDATTPVPVIGQPCDCCCSCFAFGTPIAYAQGSYKAIEEFAVGDLVLVADNAELTSWSQKQVIFSSGAGGIDSSNLLLMVIFETPDGKIDFLMSSRDQIYLLADRKLKIASKLVPGQDELLMFDNRTAKIHALRTGHFNKGLHHISTSLQPSTQVGGHLLVAKGIVVGDYALQISQISDETKIPMSDNHRALPTLGTATYLAAYPHLAGDEFGVQTIASQTPAPDPSAQFKSLMKEASFKPLDATKPLMIPDYAQYFLSKKQAGELVANNAPSYPPASINTFMLDYFFRLYKGFYPEVQFYCDKDNLEPNAYSFIYAGLPFIVVNYALIRLQAMKFELLAFVIAHELAHLYGGEPQDENGYSCTGQADYAAIQMVLPMVFFGHRAQPIIDAVSGQLTTLFGYIKAHRGGTSSDQCHDISLDCRLRTIQAAGTLNPLPNCAGGPPDPALAVVSASAAKENQGVVVTIKFNLAVAPTSATAAGNYEFSPEADVVAVAVDSNDATAVKVTTKELQAHTAYKVWAYNVLTQQQQPLISDQNVAAFTFAG